MFARDKIITSV